MIASYICGMRRYYRLSRKIPTGDVLRISRTGMCKRLQVVRVLHGNASVDGSAGIASTHIRRDFSLALLTQYLCNLLRLIGCLFVAFLVHFIHPLCNRKPMARMDSLWCSTIFHIGNESCGNRWDPLLVRRRMLCRNGSPCHLVCAVSRRLINNRVFL